MEHPWGISGPDFLWLYGAGLAVALGWALGVRALARRPRLAEPPPTPGLEELAYLAGGPRRAIELAIARLIEDGAVRANRGGTIRAVQEARAGDPVGAAVLTALGNRSPNVNKLIRSVRAPEHFEGLAHRLTAQRLILAPREVARAGRVALLLPFSLLAVGAVRFVNGAVNMLPVAYLVIELVVTVLAIVLLTRRRIRPRTVHGDRVLEGARVAVTGGVGPVALGGLAVFPDLEVRGVLAPVMKSRVATSTAVGGVYAACAATTSGGGWSGDSGGGGSSCGGGGGGGGGCGGGGGG